MAINYFTANPDVAEAYEANSYGMTPQAFADTHYQNYGVNEQRAAPSDALIKDFVTQNIGNPQAIADAAQQYGVSAADLSRATGYGMDAVTGYFGNAGINFGQPEQQATTPAPFTPQPPTPPPPVQDPYQPPQTPIYEPVYQPPTPPVYGTDPGFAPPTPVTSPQDPNAVQQRIIEEERKRNIEGGLASLGAGLPGASNAGGSPKPVDLGNGTYRTYGGTIIDKDGRPVTQATTPAPVTPPPPTTPAYFLANPDVAAEYAKNSYGLTPEQYANTHYANYGQYEQRASTTGAPAVIKPPPSRDDVIQNYVSDVLGNTGLTQFEKVNNIMEAAQKNNVSVAELQKLYGKDIVDNYIKDYGSSIKGFITNTLADKTKSDFDKVAVINQAANKYGLDANEIAQYSGLNKKGVDQMFTTFETGLAGIAKNLSAPTVSDLDKTKGALSLQSKYGISDDQLAKAIGGNVTGKDVAAYLAPVKNFGSDLQTLTSDQTKTASDIQAFLDKAKKDPRIDGLYGLAIDKVQKAVPILGLRDSIAGNGSPEQLTKGYTDFVAAVNSDPALREKYGAQADAIDKVAKMSQRIADEKFGGKLQPHMFQTFIGLDQKTLGDVPKQLETTKPETKTITDNEGQTQTYTVPGQVKDTKGLEPVYTIIGSGEDQTQQLAGYTKPIKTSAGVTVDAQYDVNGTLTGYRGRPEDKVWPAHRVGVTGVWDADGKAKPEQRVETPGFAKSMLQDISALGPIGQLAIAAATGGLGSLATGALSSALGPTLAKVVGSGLVSGTMSEIGGGKFGKGFLTGAAGAGTNALAQNFMPTIDTGSAFADQYLTKALPNLATSTIGAAINKQDIGQAGLSSLLNTGTNMATSSLINSAMPDTLTPEMQKMFTGVSGQLLSSLLQGQSPDLQKSIMSTIMQNAMSPSKTTAKEKG